MREYPFISSFRKAVSWFFQAHLVALKQAIFFWIQWVIFARPGVSNVRLLIKMSKQPDIA